MSGKQNTMLHMSHSLDTESPLKIDNVLMGDQLHVAKQLA